MTNRVLHHWCVYVCVVCHDGRGSEHILCFLLVFLIGSCVVLSGCPDVCSLRLPLRFYQTVKVISRRTLGCCWDELPLFSTVDVSSDLRWDLRTYDEVCVVWMLLVADVCFYLFERERVVEFEGRSELLCHHDSVCTDAVDSCVCFHL